MRVDFENGSRINVFLRLIGKLKPGVTLQQAQVQLDGIAAELRQRFPIKQTSGLHFRLEPMYEDLVSDVRPAILALSQDVPILPMYIEGARDILPPGTQRSQPAPVHLRIGPLLRLPQGTNIADAKRMMEDAIRELADAPREAKAA